MKKIFKIGVPVLLIAAIVLGAFAVYAAETVRIVVDNHELYATDVNGNKVDPIVIDGTTYLPVRAIATALGKEVYWDGPGNTVYLGNMDGTLPYPSLTLEDATNIGDTYHGKKEVAVKDNYGNSYNNALLYSPVWGNTYTAEYLLNGKYNSFRATFAVPEGESNAYEVVVTVKTDGKAVYTKTFDKTTKPEHVNIDVRGCNDFVVEFSSPNESDVVGVYLADGGFYQ